MTVAYGCCVGSWTKLRNNVIPKTAGRPLIAMSGQTSIPRAYNSILDACAGRGLDALILLHDDLEILDPQAEEKFLAALSEPDVALVGVAGGRGIDSLAWWDRETVGHQYTDERLLDFGPRTGDVQLIEGSVMAFGRWAIEHLRFDTRFTGFHGYDDIGMCAIDAGKRVVVADIATHHHTCLGFKSSESRRLWLEANRRFKRKWDL